MDLGLKDKRVLVMGASMGIGRGIAESFIREDAKVAICARNEDRLNKVAAEMHANLAVQADLSQKTDVSRLMETVVKEFGGIDVVVFNTGGPDIGQFLDIPVEKWESSFQGLWIHVLQGLQFVLPKMQEQGWGRILLVTSVAAKEPVPGLTISNAFRAGLLGLVNSVSKDVASQGVTFNAIMPGYIKTERLADLNVDESVLVENVPAKRIGLPKEIGSLCTFLASEQASYITGQAIACDGGLLKSI